MIHTRCPHCNSKVKAPDELAGKKGRCPDCLGVVPLPEDMAEEFGSPPPATTEALPSISFTVDDTAPTEKIVAEDAAAESKIAFKRPEHLHRNCHYLICSGKDVIARWDDDGKGWMVQVKDGFVKAQNNTQQLPSMGNYTFIEIEIVSEGPHQRLAGVHAFTLPGAFALTKLAKHEDAILEALEQTTALNDRQRTLVRQRVNAKYLPSIWDDAAEF